MNSDSFQPWKKKLTKTDKRKAAKERIQVNVRLRPFSKKEMQNEGKTKGIIHAFDTDSASIEIRKDGGKT